MAKLSDLKKKASKPRKKAKAKAKKAAPKKKVVAKRGPPFMDQKTKDARAAEFVSALMRNEFNQQKAYTEAFGALKTANATKASACRLFGTPEVQLALYKACQDRRQRCEIEEDYVLRRWLAMAEANLMDYMSPSIQEDGSLVLTVEDWNNLTKEQQQNIREVKVKTSYVEQGKGEPPMKVQEVQIKLHDARAVMDSIARHLGMFVDVNVNLVVPVAERLRSALQRAMESKGRTIEHEP